MYRFPPDEFVDEDDGDGVDSSVYTENQKTFPAPTRRRSRSTRSAPFGLYGNHSVYTDDRFNRGSDGTIFRNIRVYPAKGEGGARIANTWILADRREHRRCGQELRLPGSGHAADEREAPALDSSEAVSWGRAGERSSDAALHRPRARHAAASCLVVGLTLLAVTQAGAAPAPTLRGDDAPRTCSGSRAGWCSAPSWTVATAPRSRHAAPTPGRPRSTSPTSPSAGTNAEPVRAGRRPGHQLHDRARRDRDGRRPLHADVGRQQVRDPHDREQLVDAELPGEAAGRPRPGAPWATPSRSSRSSCSCSATRPTSASPAPNQATTRAPGRRRGDRAVLRAGRTLRSRSRCGPIARYVMANYSRVDTGRTAEVLGRPPVALPVPARTRSSTTRPATASTTSIYVREPEDVPGHRRRHVHLQPDRRRSASTATSGTTPTTASTSTRTGRPTATSASTRPRARAAR